MLPTTRCRSRSGKSRSYRETSTRGRLGGSRFEGLVGEAGLEPTISCSQSTCVTNYATPRRFRAHESPVTTRKPNGDKPTALRPITAAP